jgi:carnitine-CoA ligase
MADGIAPSRTIPQVLVDAASRDPGGVWLRTDDGSLTFGGAQAQVAATAAALHSLGVRHGDLVMTTARTTPPYLICWLALASLGAVTVPVNPRSAPAELAGLVHQTQPRAIISDAGQAGHIAPGGRPAARGRGEPV